MFECPHCGNLSSINCPEECGLRAQATTMFRCPKCEISWGQDKTDCPECSGKLQAVTMLECSQCQIVWGPYFNCSECDARLLVVTSDEGRNAKRLNEELEMDCVKNMQYPSPWSYAAEDERGNGATCLWILLAIVAFAVLLILKVPLILTGLCLSLGGLAGIALTNLIGRLVLRPALERRGWAMGIIYMLLPIVPVSISAHVTGILLLATKGILVLWNAIFG
jgi:hypothetical protein